MMGRSWRRFDWMLLLLTVALTGIGIAMIGSATGSWLMTEEPILENAVIRQALFAIGGMIPFFVAAAIDYRIWKTLRYVLYLAALAPLGLLLVAGHTSFGARSWLGANSVQPSEFVKILVVLVLARQLAVDQDGELDRFRHLLVSLLLVVPVVLLIYLQPDLGTAAIVAITWVCMVFAAGVRWRHLATLGVLGVVAAPTLWFSVEGYMRDRIIDFLNPQRDPSGASYNVTQALISVGSGGLWGKGYARGTQSQLRFLRVRHTDFLFSVLAEEMGFIGCVFLLIFILLLLFRILRVAESSHDSFGRLIVVGVASMIMAQSLINLAMNLNLLPVTGLPLPLVSYGGSSLITTLIGLGLVESVSMGHRKLDFAEGRIP